MEETRQQIIQAVTNCYQHSTELFGVDDEMFMDMFVGPGALDTIHNERRSLRKRQKSLMSCLDEFKNISQALQQPRIYEHELNEVQVVFIAATYSSLIPFSCMICSAPC